MLRNLIIFKIGGSVITFKDSLKPKPNLKNIRLLAEEISRVKEGLNLVLVHGAGSYGHPIVQKTGIHKGIKNKAQLLAFAETQKLQNELNLLVTKNLIKKGLPATPFQANTCAILEKGRVKSFFLETIKGFLKMHLIPVLYGVPAYDVNQGCSILSGDQIVSFLARKLEPKLLLFGVNVDGLIGENSQVIKKVTDIKQVIHYIRKTSYLDVTGGMEGKLKEIIDLKIETRIFNATIPGNIEKALKGEEIGTTINPCSTLINS